MTQSSHKLDLLSVHVPKCGGSSLGLVLGQIYANSLLHDSGDRPGDPASPMNIDPDGFLDSCRMSLPRLLQGKLAVHGHFHPKKYSSIRFGFRTAIIREPVARLVSHYNYWLHMPREGHLLHNYFLDQHLDIEAFARLPFIRYMYTKVYFGGMAINDFDFIGSLEALPEAFRHISVGIGHPMKVVLANKGVALECQDTAERVATDRALHSRLVDLLADDIRFYESVRGRWA